MGRGFFLLLLGALVVTLPCTVTAADLVNIPMDHQINLGNGDVITAWGTLSFQPAGGGEPDGWARNSFPGGWRGPNVSFAAAGIAPVDCSDPRTVM